MFNILTETQCQVSTWPTKYFEAGQRMTISFKDCRFGSSPWIGIIDSKIGGDTGSWDNLRLHRYRLTSGLAGFRSGTLVINVPFWMRSYRGQCQFIRLFGDSSGESARMIGDAEIMQIKARYKQFSQPVDPNMTTQPPSNTPSWWNRRIETNHPVCDHSDNGSNFLAFFQDPNVYQKGRIVGFDSQADTYSVLFDNGVLTKTVPVNKVRDVTKETRTRYREGFVVL